MIVRSAGDDDKHLKDYEKQHGDLRPLSESTVCALVEVGERASASAHRSPLAVG
jgi:hypothetical protein